MLPPLGAHVSTAGGVHRAPSRAAGIGADALQLFTKPPRRWAEHEISDETVLAFRQSRDAAGIRVAASHDSYLINLATPDARLLAKSARTFRSELARCERLGLEFLVTHPGHATGGDRARALRQNADQLGAALESVPGQTRVLIETTAGGGSALGGRFEEIAALIADQSAATRARLAVCLDTAHVFAAGYDIKSEYEAVMQSFDDVIGLDLLALIHCNDSAGRLGSHRDRHAEIGKGELGEATFASLMRDPRLRAVPRVLETPKGDDATTADRRNLATLRRLALA